MRVFARIGLSTLTALITIAWWDHLALEPYGVGVITHYLLVAALLAFAFFVAQIGWRLANKQPLGFAKSGTYWSLANGIVIAALSLPVFAQAAPEASDTSASRTLSIVTANLWNNSDAIDSFLAYVQAEEPDILFVQEAYEPWRSEFATALPDYTRAAGCFYAHNCNAVIYSKTNVLVEVEGDGSGYVAARLSVPGEGEDFEFLAISVHLSRGKRRQKSAQLAVLREAINSSDVPVLLAGDFNLTPWDKRLQTLIEETDLKRFSGLSPTWPTPSRVEDFAGVKSEFPGVVIDHVFADPIVFKSIASSRFDFGSDHYAVTVQLQHSE
ncbi:MAG: endonuclease/exonuclease/phosphatase family protein [Pseudomonadota bacterium]